METTSWSDRDYYRATLSRDTRFDGDFFVGVTSTGIYCRPVCPAKKPRFENCVFVSSAAAAEDLGYRPCHRCRPETAPGSAAWMGTDSTVSRALRLLSEEAGDGTSVDDVATRLGITSRHLRRLFNERLGASPKAVVQTERFHIARQLLVQTDMNMAQVAFSSGFQSIRRFNDAVKNAFGLTPSEYRVKARSLGPSGTSPNVQLRLGYRPPFAWGALLSYLERRAIPEVERVRGHTYERTVAIDGARGLLRVEPPDSPRPARHQARVEFALDEAIHLGRAVRRVRDLLDLDAATEDVESRLHTDDALAPLVDVRPGLRIPGCWDVFELAVRAVVGQQVSVSGATTLLSRLVRACGARLECDLPMDRDTLTHLFPTSERVAESEMDSVGLTKRRVQTLRALAQAFAHDPGYVDVAMPLGEAIERLRSIHGIGDWTAQYIALRALRHPDAFPAGDLGLLKATGLEEESALYARAEAWRPWRGYAALHLWTHLSHMTNQEEDLP